MLCRLLLVLVFLPTAAWADRAADLARIHVEAIGGQARLQQMESLRVTGRVTIDGRTLRITLLAARPNRVRTETSFEEATLVQGYDGENEPWVMDLSSERGELRTMQPLAAREFIADAEFDNPLIAGSDRGFIIDYAGEAEVQGRAAYKLLVMRELTETFTLFLEAETYLILQRTHQRRLANGTVTTMETRYADFRPVQGVLLPHRITVASGGRILHETRLDAVEANPLLAASVFSRPEPLPNENESPAAASSRR